MTPEKIKITLKGIFTKNWKLKLVSIGIAALLWMFVIAETNPPRVKEFTDVPVTFQNADVLAKAELTTSVPLSEIISGADVSIEANTNVLKNIEKDEISLYVDLSSITQAGEATLNIKGKTEAGSIVNINPSKITVNVEKLVEKEIPVSVEVKGSRQSGYYYGEPHTVSDTVTVSGPESIIQEYAKAVCYVDVTNATSSINESREVSIFNKEGNEIVATSQSSVPSIIVTMDILPCKTVDIDRNAVISSISGIAEGYEIKDIVMQPQAVSVVGEKDVIGEISSVSIEPIALENATQDTVVTAKIVTPKGAALTDPAEIDLTVKIGVIEETRVYEAMDIEVKNLASEYECTINPQAVDVEVTGTSENLATIDASSIQPIIDAADLGVGTHTVSIKFENSPDIPAELSPSYYTVEIKITKKQG